MTVQPFLLGEGWMAMRDGDASCRAIFDRHYSRYVYADGRKPKLFVGPGEKLVLMRADGSGLFVWRKFISRDGQMGVNCSIFRNEGGGLASGLILEAEAFADARWSDPLERFFTYVGPRGVRPTLVKGPRGLVYPVWGYCFLQAGWTWCGVTSKGLLIYEKTASARAERRVA